jgi:RNA polymerase sigma factor (sigma-70 family)
MAAEGHSRDNEGPGSGTASSRRLLGLARQGDTQALDRLMARHLPRLYRWTRGRLPRWARDLADTTDLVQDTLLNALGTVERFEPARAGALQSYLRQAVQNRISREFRRAGSRPIRAPLDPERMEAASEGSPLESAIGSETAALISAALSRLTPDEQELVVARVELGYSYEQIALLVEKRTPDAARVAVSRALLRLAEEMGRAG